MSIANWNAGIIRPVAVAPTGSFDSDAAPGMWTLDQVAYWSKQGLWPIPGNKRWFIGSYTQSGHRTEFNDFFINSTGDYTISGGQSIDGTGTERAILVETKPTSLIDFQIGKFRTSSRLRFSSIGSDSSGNIYCSGVTGIGTNQPYIVKFSPAGSVLYELTFNTINQEDWRPYAFSAINAAGDTYLNLATQNSENQQYAGYFVKLNSSGVIQYSRKLTNTAGYIVRRVGLDNNGDPFFLLSFINESDHYAFIKFSADGTYQYTRRISPVTLHRSGAHSITFDTGGNYYVCGFHSIQTNPSPKSAILVKYNSSGTVLFHKALQFSQSPGGSLCEFLGVTVGADGFVYTVGFIQASDVHGAGGILAKYSSAGILQWQRKISVLSNPTYAIYLNTVKINSKGDIVVLGTIADGGGTGLLLTLPSDGSRTGTYGNYVYSVTTLTDTQAAITLQAVTDSPFSQAVSTTSQTYTTSNPSLVVIKDGI